MDPQETRRETLNRVTRELGTEIRSQARDRWKGVRTAERNEGDRHVWRFKSSKEAPERFLHVHRQALVHGDNPAAVLLDQLTEARWLDRLQEGPETSFVLSRAGRLRPYIGD